ncbi:L(+)-tartrate dehydratase subunit alpha [Klebsiella pneumoniae]|nr:L(+)-tartrate dehydratase subunit alpha [Klebsiella pneumoniae]
MSKSEQISRMTDIMARFVGYTGKVLPDDVTAKLQDLHKKETSQLADVIFTTMIENQRLAKELDRPSCQDTGVIQFLVECGANFPLIGELEALLRESVIKATIDSPLRHNSVETFDEYNTGKKRRQRDADGILGDRSEFRPVQHLHLYGWRRLLAAG